MNKSYFDLDKLHLSLGRWSYICLIASIFLFSLFTGFKPVSLFTDLPGLLTGSVAIESQRAVLETITIVLHQTAILLAVGLTLLIIIRRVVGAENIKAAFDPMKLFEKGPRLIYLSVFLEELIFRQILIGWVRTFLGGGLLITVLLILIGNALFALPHILNHAEGHRKPILILPQLILGLILTFIFLEYGFWVALLAHLTYDFVLFSVIKLQLSIVEDVISGAYWLIIGVAAYLILSSMGVGLTTLSPWVTNTTLTTLSLSPWQMITLLIFISAVFGVIANLFALDEPSPDMSIFREHPGAAVIGLLIAPLVYVFIIIGLSWLLGVFHLDPYSKAILIVLIVFITASPKSGSGMANLWFTGTPITFLYVFVALTFSFVNAAMIIFTVMLASIFPIMINAYLGDLSK